HVRASPKTIAPSLQRVRGHGAPHQLESAAPLRRLSGSAASDWSHRGAAPVTERIGAALAAKGGRDLLLDSHHAQIAFSLVVVEGHEPLAKGFTLLASRGAAVVHSGA